LAELRVGKKVHSLNVKRKKKLTRSKESVIAGKG